MGTISDYLENELVDHLLGTAFTAPTTIYLALCESAPVDSDTGSTITESSYTSYARTAITFGAAASRRVTQNALVTFPASTGGSSTVTHWALCDATSAGNVLASGALTTSKSIVSGNTPSVANTEVYVEFSAGGVSDYAANASLDLVFRNQAFSAPSTYVGLTTATISDSSTGATVTEVANSGAYARVQVNASGGASPAWSAASGGAANNADAITFTTATGSWGTVTSGFVVDSATHGAGNILFYGNDVVDQLVGNGDTVQLSATSLDFSIS